MTWWRVQTAAAVASWRTRPSSPTSALELFPLVGSVGFVELGLGVGKCCKAGGAKQCLETTTQATSLFLPEDLLHRGAR